MRVFWRQNTHKKRTKKKPAFICELFFEDGGEGGIYSRRPWRSPCGSPEAVQNGCPAVLSNPVEGSHPLPAGRNMRKKSPHLHASSSLNMAVREGFEPSIRCRIHTFQACSFSHSDTSPYCRSSAAGTGANLGKTARCVNANFMFLVHLAKLHPT